MAMTMTTDLGAILQTVCFTQTMAMAMTLMMTTMIMTTLMTILYSSPFCKLSAVLLRTYSLNDLIALLSKAILNSMNHQQKNINELETIILTHRYQVRMMEYKPYGTLQ